MMNTIIKNAPGVVIHPRCEHFIAGIEGGYCRVKPKDGRQMDIKPYKDGFYEHVQDANRYIIDGIFRSGNMTERVDHVKIQEPGWGYNVAGGRY